MEDYAVGPHKGYCFDHIIGKGMLRRWYRDEYGNVHRLGGPAVEWEDGRKEWWYHGYKTNASSQEEFDKYLKLKVFW
jgi:hypothetical protein